MSPVDPLRVRILNDRSARTGEYVLYWMQSSHRTTDNPALQYAVERADRAHLPLIAYFGIWQAYPESNLRHFRFMLEGLAEVAQSLESLGIGFVVRNEHPETGFCSLAANAAVVVTDRGYLRQQREWYASLAARCRAAFVQVEGDVVVPVEIASAHEEYSAATLRRRILPLLDRFLVRSPETGGPEQRNRLTDLPTLAGEPIERILGGLVIDRTVGPSPVYRGGAVEAERRFAAFLENGLDRYAGGHSDPASDGGSGMSPFLHFGQVSPVSLALRARDHGGSGATAFLEQLIVRRELAVNFVRYNERYDSFSCLPAWAQQTLERHTADRRAYEYAAGTMERAATHDPYWNAAQQEMVTTGRMNGYMRMYWGKKILEWSPTPQEGYATALFLNNRYEIDGRDPNGYAGVAWCFGKHDRPWGERDVFGTVRSMTAGGLMRKFAMEDYLKRVARYG